MAVSVTAATAVSVATLGRQGRPQYVEARHRNPTEDIVREYLEMWRESHG
jgi:hypothetical protein